MLALRSRTRRALLAALPLALLGACASAPRPPALLAGRLAVQVEASAEHPAQALSASFELSGDEHRGELRLASALGTQLAQAHWTPQAVWLRTASGEQRYPDLPALAQAYFGQSLPLQALPDWLRGLPWAGAPSRALAAPALGFEQLGWTIDTAHAAQGRIDARWAGPPAVRLRAQLDQPS